MFKCESCGHIFDEGEERITREYHTEIEGGFYENLASCPCCGSEDYEEARRCLNCGGAYLDDELFDGWCLECLTEAIDYDSALKYFLQDKETFHLFMFEKFFKMRLPDEISWEMTNHLFEVYGRMRADDLLTNRTAFLDLIRTFILEEDGDYGKINFAEWLNEVRARKGVR